MDQLTIQRIETMHPLLREELKRQYKEINNQLPKGVRLRFTSCFRTFQEQDELYKKRPKVTNAKGGQSIHNYGLAFDICILLDKDGNGTFETAVWKGQYFDKVVKYFKSKGWEWGGDFKSFKDNPHFQIDFGYTWKQLKNKIDNGDFIVENNIKYVNI